MKKLRYIFPKTDNFREERPLICWEKMYGWIDGYGMLFDPEILKLTGKIPEWENGFNEEINDGDFIISPCHQASAYFTNQELPPGIFVRPVSNGRLRISEKESFLNPVENMFYPDKMEYDVYENGIAGWEIGESPVIKRSGRGITVGFELFAISGNFIHEWPEKRLLVFADMLSVILKASSHCEKAANCPDKSFEKFRLDFQAYGVNRLLVQWLLELEGGSKSGVAEADKFIMQALTAFNEGDSEKITVNLKQAFETLAGIRRAVAPVEMKFIEIPHIGILLDDKAFFEFEWPEFSRKILDSYFCNAEHYGFRLALEAGASCWEKLLARYPKFADRMRKTLASGNLELVNGTFSLPYALLSPLAVQYLQFEKGTQIFKKLFGKSPGTYQCQENSLTSQMPELLKHFGFDYAFHITQNHGAAPAVKEDFIRWTSFAGHGIVSACVSSEAMGRLGINYYLDLPIHASRLKGKNEQLYPNFMDLGYVPFRIHMIRAHHYAGVWGRYVLPAEIFPASSSCLPDKCYNAEDYSLAEKAFYGNRTNIDAISHYEDLFKLFAEYRQLKIIGSNSQLSMDREEKALCFYEAHDCSIVGGQRRGEFYGGGLNMETPPCTRDTLVESLLEIRNETSGGFAQCFKAIQPESTRTLFNASEVVLAFARVRHPEGFSGKGLLKVNENYYATGEFLAFTSTMPSGCSSVKQPVPYPFKSWKWETECDGEWIAISFAGRTIRFRVIDKRNGGFRPYFSKAEKAGDLNLIEIRLESDSLPQTVRLSLLFSDSGEYTEINLNYSPRCNFTPEDKWDDYLALEFDCGGFEKLLQFNPNVYSVAHKDKICSPYCLTVETVAGGIGLLNEGAVLYEIDRNSKLVRWLFHVDGESVCRRRMAVNFGRQDNFLLARAWSSGLVPFEGNMPDCFAGKVPDGISIENLIAPGIILISNLKNADNSFAVSNNFHVENLCGEVVSKGGKAMLKPFEVALIKTKIKI